MQLRYASMINMHKMKIKKEKREEKELVKNPKVVFK